jgi:hypothetical protein
MKEDFGANFEISRSDRRFNVRADFAASMKCHLKKSPKSDGNIKLSFRVNVSFHRGPQKKHKEFLYVFMEEW